MCSDTVWTIGAQCHLTELSVYSAPSLWPCDCTDSVKYKWTVHLWVHLQRTLHLHRAPVSALTVHNASELCTDECTDGLHRQCTRRGTRCVSAVRCVPLLHTAGSHFAADGRGARVECSTCAARAREWHRCAQKCCNPQFFRTEIPAWHIAMPCKLGKSEIMAQKNVPFSMPANERACSETRTDGDRRNCFLVWEVFAPVKVYIFSI